MPLFGRQALHPDVDMLVGDFTSSLLLDIDLTGTAPRRARAQAVQDAMRTAAAHSGYPGLSVLRDLSRHRGTQVLAPVVFTSALGTRRTVLSATSPSSSARRHGSSRRARRCCSTHRSPSSTAASW